VAGIVAAVVLAAGTGGLVAYRRHSSAPTRPAR
jgi:hypothetical protein